MLVVLQAFPVAAPGESVAQELPAAGVVLGDLVREIPCPVGIRGCFRGVDDALFARMYGKSYKADCTVPRSELRYLRVLHRNLAGETLLGELVCNEAICGDLLDIFRVLYDTSYPIERMVLIDEYDAQDGPSMRANNSSA